MAGMRIDLFLMNVPCHIPPISAADDQSADVKNLRTHSFDDIIPGISEK